ncbi:MAG TPA: sigma-70 family RNA polymerase sigma factor, partial [Chitinophagaceae bacterium]
MNKGELIPHLFRTEYRKIIAVLCRRFGANYINDAEDIASETFLTAVQAWGVEGIPENPTAWLYHVAKNKAANHLRRQAIFDKKVVVDIESNIPKQLEEDINLSPQNIRDSELQMMFAICHPIIPPEAQTGLCLRLLCGFGIDEIAEAYLATRETIYKRLARAK